MRLAQAKARFGTLWKLWNSELPQSAQLNLYAAAAIAILTHGHQAWPLTGKVCTALMHFNARNLAKITGKDHRDSYKSQHEYYDLIGILRSRRLSWIATNLRSTGPNFARGVLIARIQSDLDTNTCGQGTTLMDVPSHPSVGDLIAIASDTESWNILIGNVPSTPIRDNSTHSRHPTYKQDFPALC